MAIDPVSAPSNIPPRDRPETSLAKSESVKARAGDSSGKAVNINRGEDTVELSDAAIAASKELQASSSVPHPTDPEAILASSVSGTLPAVAEAVKRKAKEEQQSYSGPQ